MNLPNHPRKLAAAHDAANTACAEQVAGLRSREGLRVSWLSFWVNIFLIGLKFSVGVISGSFALIADGVHSVVDLASDVAAIFGLKMAGKPHDAGHPYGHHKFASLCAFLISLSIVVFCAGLIYSSIAALLKGQNEIPGISALWVALLAMLIKEGMYRYAHRMAKRLKSRILMANALDHRTDAVASLLVLVAVGAAHVGGQSWVFLDKLAGLVLGCFLGFGAVKLLWGAVQDLLDAAPNREILNDLREHILPVPGVVAYHNFRARRVGDMYEVDLHVQVLPDISVSAGHDVSEAVKAAILEKHPEVIEVMVHIEPADEENLKKEGLSGKKRT